MVKAKNKRWDDIKEKKKVAGETTTNSKKDENEGDPSASLMNMMKDLYETGDDNMKRTIAESWQKANQEKAKGQVWKCI